MQDHDGLENIRMEDPDRFFAEGGPIEMLLRFDGTARNPQWMG